MRYYATTYTHSWSFCASIPHLVAWLVFQRVFSRQYTPSSRDLQSKLVLFKGKLHLSMMTEENTMDGLLKEAQQSQSASAKPSKTLASSELESSLHPSRDVQPGTTVTGTARPPSATHTGQTNTTSELGLAELNHKVDQLTSLMSCL